MPILLTRTFRDRLIQDAEYQKLMKHPKMMNILKIFQDSDSVDPQKMLVEHFKGNSIT